MLFTWCGWAVAGDPKTEVRSRDGSINTRVNRYIRFICVEYPITIGVGIKVIWNSVPVLIWRADRSGRLIVFCCNCIVGRRIGIVDIGVRDFCRIRDQTRWRQTCDFICKLYRLTATGCDHTDIPDVRRAVVAPFTGVRAHKGQPRGHRIGDFDSRCENVRVGVGNGHRKGHRVANIHGGG